MLLKFGVSHFNVIENRKVHKLIFHIIDGQCKSIIGLKYALDLGLLKLCVNYMEASTGRGNVDSNTGTDLKGLEN